MNLAGWIAMLIGLLVALAVTGLPLILSEPRQAAQERARARRLAETKRNARLLRLNI